MNTLTLEVILRVVFGVTDERRLAALRPCVNATVDSTRCSSSAPTGRCKGCRPYQRVVDNQEELDRLIYAEIRERRVAPDLAERTDVLSRLIREGQDSDDPAERLDDTELRDQLVTLLLAGHETTATCPRLGALRAGARPRAHAPHAGSRGRWEAGDDAWLDAVMKESMRLHPVIPIVLRTLQKPATIAGIDIPAGTTVGPSIVVAHGDANYERAPTSSTRTGSSARTRRRTPGSPSAAAYGGASAPASHSWKAPRSCARCSAPGRSSPSTEDTPRVRNITSVPDLGARIKVLPR